MVRRAYGGGVTVTAAGSEPPRLLVVDDDPKLAGLVAEYLEREGFVVSTEGSGGRAVERIVNEHPDVVILDVMLPGIDGFEVCRRVRTRYQGLILMLTARGEEIDEVLGLESGADDYLAKPVRPRLLLTRIRALLRRIGGAGRDDEGDGPEAPIDCGSLRVDPANRRATVDDRDLELTTAEFDLLACLAQRAGRVVSRDELYRRLRGIEYDGLDRSIDLCVARLRKKVEADPPHPKWIKSVRGTGYLLARAASDGSPEPEPDAGPPHP